MVQDVWIKFYGRGGPPQCYNEIKKRSSDRVYCSLRLLKSHQVFSSTCSCCVQSTAFKKRFKAFQKCEWSNSLLRHFKIRTLLKINCCMASISAFGVTQHSQIFSLFFRNRIQCIALYQLHNSQALLNLRSGYFIRSHFPLVQKFYMILHPDVKSEVTDRPKVRIFGVTLEYFVSSKRTPFSDTDKCHFRCNKCISLIGVFFFHLLTSL